MVGTFVQPNDGESGIWVVDRSSRRLLFIFNVAMKTMLWRTTERQKRLASYLVRTRHWLCRVAVVLDYCCSLFFRVPCTACFVLLRKNDLHQVRTVIERSEIQDPSVGGHKLRRDKTSRVGFRLNCFVHRLMLLSVYEYWGSASPPL